jgi:Uncharacterized conserved protein
MSYTIDRSFDAAAFDAIVARTREALAAHGFGVLTEIDVAATMKKKLGKDMPAYLILGACNPKMAYEAIGLEPNIGAMLPCNVIVRDTGDGVTVSAVDPQASMQAIENSGLVAVAGKVRTMLENAVRDI